MKIFLNDEMMDLPNDYMTVEDLMKWKEIQPQGTAIAINDRMIRKDNWNLTRLSNLDRITVISAAFGG